MKPPATRNGHPFNSPRYDPVSTQDVVRRMTDDGWTPREIAQRLHISTQAVYYHLERLADEYDAS